VNLVENGEHREEQQWIERECGQCSIGGHCVFLLRHVIVQGVEGFSWLTSVRGQ